MQLYASPAPAQRTGAALPRVYAHEHAIHRARPSHRSRGYVEVHHSCCTVVWVNENVEKHDHCVGFVETGETGETGEPHMSIHPPFPIRTQSDAMQYGILKQCLIREPIYKCYHDIPGGRRFIPRMNVMTLYRHCRTLHVFSIPSMF